MIPHNLRFIISVECESSYLKPLDFKESVYDLFINRCTPKFISTILGSNSESRKPYLVSAVYIDLPCCKECGSNKSKLTSFPIDSTLEDVVHNTEFYTSPPKEDLFNGNAKYYDIDIYLQYQRGGG